LRLRDVAPWRHAAREPDIAPNRRPTAKGDPAKNGCAGIDHDVILDDGMPGSSLEQSTLVIHGEPLGSRGHGLIQADLPADDRGLADDNTGAVVNEEAAANLGAGMNVDPRVSMGNLCNNAGKQRSA
jgi:hypothetical protein